MTNAFQVDLAGVVDLFARHLYSSPRVYLRELLQNGVDAITARSLDEPDAPATVRIRCTPGGLSIQDSGVGLTYEQAGDLLATIGRSSKRADAIESARTDYIGQFGIGLLSSFMVAEHIEMTSRSATDRNAPPIRWVGNADGTYELERLASDDPAAPSQPGSIVTLTARSGSEHWLEPAMVQSLAEDFGGLLPLNVSIALKLDDGEEVWKRLTVPELPWNSECGDHQAKLARYCEQTLGFTPLTSFDLNLPAIGLSGVAFVLPTATSPSSKNVHRVYLKRMLLGAQVTDLLPDWAFFVRCVVNTSALRPTASREALYEDDIMIATREALGRRILEWTIGMLGQSSETQAQFVSVHNLAIRSLALHSDEMLDLAAQVLPYETTDGPMTLAEFFAAQQQIRYSLTVEDYKRIAPVASAQGLGVVNGGYVYDSELLSKLAQRKPEWRVEPLAAADVDHVLGVLAPEQEIDFLEFLSIARATLESVDCIPVVREFSPAELPALLVTDSDIEHQADLERTRDQVGGMWGGILDKFSKQTAQRKLVLNARNNAVTVLARGTDADVQAAGTRTLYVTARLLAGEVLRGPDAVMMNESLGTLLTKATRTDSSDEH